MSKDYATDWAEKVQQKIHDDVEIQILVNNLKALANDVLIDEIKRLRQMLMDDLYNSKSYISVTDLIIAICEEWGIQPFEFTTKCRERKYVLPRHVFFWLMGRKIMPHSLSKVSVSEIAGKKDHSVVLHGERVINNMLETDVKFRKRMMSFLRKIGYGSKETDEGNLEFWKV